MDEVQYRHRKGAAGRGGLVAGLLIGIVFLFVRTGFSSVTGFDIDTKFQQPCIDQGCHAVDLVGTMPRHLPYLEGQCLACHTDHSVSVPGLLKQGGDLLCLGCHKDVDLNEKEQIHATQNTPEGGRESCVSCHDPHESPNSNLVRHEATLEGCANCHSDFLKAGGEQPFRHDFFDPIRQCGACHYAHQRPREKYLREEVAQSCLTCHDLAIQIAGRKLENVGAKIRESKQVHAAMQEQSCPACHTPHGSIQSSLLRPGYPAGSYQTYRRENYALCWQCHDPGIVENAGGEGLTNFRDGNTNLHRVHVLEMRRGRACHVCHTAHASETEHLLRERIPFGEWQAPLTFTEEDFGGSCATPCHREKSYSRTKSPDLR